MNATGASNYAHWCLDLLPQIAVACTHFPASEVMVPGYAPLRFAAQSIEHFGLSASTPKALALGTYRIAELTVLNASVSGSARHGLQLGNRPYAEHLLRRRPAPQNERTLRLFVDRPPPQRRSVINRAEFLGALARHGFEPIDPGRLDVTAQAAAFASASHVLGLHGAAMTNVIHCRAGTRVLEIHSPEHSMLSFAISALVTGCAYRAHLGRSAAREGRLWHAPQDMDFLIDIEALERDLAWLLD